MNPSGSGRTLNAPCRRRSRPAAGSSAEASVWISSGEPSNGSADVVAVGSSRRIRQLEAEHVGHLLDLRQIAQVVEPEAFEKLARRRRT